MGGKWRKFESSNRSGGFAHQAKDAGDDTAEAEQGHDAGGVELFGFEKSGEEAAEEHDGQGQAHDITPVEVLGFEFVVFGDHKSRSDEGESGEAASNEGSAAFGPEESEDAEDDADDTEKGVVVGDAGEGRRKSHGERGRA